MGLIESWAEAVSAILLLLTLLGLLGEMLELGREKGGEHDKSRTIVYIFSVLLAFLST
jgi:hypothetical protein